LTVAVGLLLLAVTAAGTADGGADLHDLRAQRRATVRAQVAAKAWFVPFGLLVLPVDFADARAPEGWDPTAELGPRLAAAYGSQSLSDYVSVASHDHAQLEVTLGPLIHLPGTRQDYSDLGWNGATRTRAMARTALEAAAALGVDFARADRDGDGEVDGVLLLHADVGLENDPDEGLIVPLQHFLEEPVVHRGVRAQSYAVAAWRSPLGVWAHETAHLFGLEDRYDLAVPSSGEVVPRGGLGVFSLMSAGYWGSGDGHDPALIDAYSASQLGWCRLESLRGDGTQPVPVGGGDLAYRVWSNGEVGPEFFVVERRGASAQYDGGVPAGLVITHVDETLPEGQASSNQWPDRHLRVRLVEADGDTSVARGLDLGDDGDVFPGATGNVSFTPESDPASEGYARASGIRITDIGPQTITVDDRVSYAGDVTLSFQGGVLPAFFLDLAESGWPLQDPEATITIESGAEYGTFDGGVTVNSFSLQTEGEGLWRSAHLIWEPAAALPPGAVTAFDILVHARDEAGALRVVAHVSRAWAWTSASPPLDIAGAWPGPWRIDHPNDDAGTTWHRWLDADGMTADGSPVLACTGAEFTEATAWPQVIYANGTDAVLVSELLPAEVTAVQMVHHAEAEALPTGAGVDAAVIEWEDSGGSVVSGVPVDGYPTATAGDAQHVLHGRPAWAGVDSLTATGAPVWRVDVVPLPAGQGPWRLRLRFATSPAFRERGWLVARLDTLRGEPPASAFPVAVEPRESGGCLRWQWSGLPGATGFVVQFSEDGGKAWADLGAAADGTTTTFDLRVPWPADARRLLRVVAQTPLGDIASRAVVWTEANDFGPRGGLGIPRPNPGRTHVLIPVDAAFDTRAELLILDVRGRVVRRWALAGGAYDVLWDGTDGAGRRSAAGAYEILLRAEGRTPTRKVTWLP
jgi:M6 family metalloprotease-like protein